MMRAITYYTDGYYKSVFGQYLRPSCETVGYAVLAIPAPNLKDWGQNTRLKAKIILDSLMKFKEDIVFLDADAVLLKYPSLFDEIPAEYDIAVHYLDWNKHWFSREGHKERELYNAAMMCRYNARVISLLQQWIQANSASKKWEQKVLEQVLLSRPDIKVYDLPVEYACVATRDGKIPDYVADPVIFQNQISRKVKSNKALLA